MKHNFALAAAIVATLFTGACSTTAGTKSSAYTQQDYEAALANAQAAQERSASVGGEWRDTGKFIKQAEAAGDKGDYETAVKLARKAEFQSNAGYDQALEQQAAGPRF